MTEIRKIIPSQSKSIEKQKNAQKRSGGGGESELRRVVRCQAGKTLHLKGIKR